MKLKDGFVMRKIAGKDIVLPSGKDMNTNIMITLNETGRFIWEHLQVETTQEKIVEAIVAKYAISSEEANDYVEEFLQKLFQHGFIEESKGDSI